MEKEQTLRDTIRTDSVNLPHGDLPPGYKRTEVGVIPEDWETVPLGDLFTFKNGLNKAKRFFGFGTPIVNYMDVYTHPGIRMVDLKGRVSLNAQEIMNFEVRKGDVFFTRTSETINEIGVAAVMLEDSPNTVFSGFVLRARPKNDWLDDAYKKYCFTPQKVRSQIISRSTYTTRALTNGRSLSAVHIPLPPLPEQRTIAAALSDADGLIGALETLIAKKRAIKQATMQQLLTGRTRLPGFANNPNNKNTEVGVIPEDWDLTTLGGICQIVGRIGYRGYTVNDIVTEGEGAIAINPSNIKGNRIDFSKCTYVTWRKYEESPEIKINEGDVLLVKTGSTYGKTAIVQNLPEKATLNPQVVVLKHIRVNNCFLSYMMAFPIIQNQISNAVVGGAVPTLSQRIVEKFSFPLPPLPEQIAIATVLSDMDAEITALEHRLEKARQIKQGMLQQLLTGRIRLPDMN